MVGAGSEDVVQLPAAGDAELAVGAGQVGFHGLDGDEQALGDLAVAVAVEGKQGDATLGRGEGVDTGDRGPARPDADGVQFGAGALGQRPGVHAVGEREAVAQRLSALLALPGAPQGRSQVHQSDSVLERGRGLPQYACRLGQQGNVGTGTGDQSGDA